MDKKAEKPRQNLAKLFDTVPTGKP